MSGSPAPGTVIAQIVETMRALAGSHPGFRPVHAKGIVCSGTFRAASEARALCRALHFQGQSVLTIIRFANASGNPEVHDGLANTRSMAVKFQLADGKNADILANSIEGFPVRTPEDLLAFLRAQLPDPVTGQPAPDAVPRFLETHPRRPRLHRAPGAETCACQLWSGRLPCRARLSVQCLGGHQAFRSLSLGARSGRGLSLPGRSAHAQRKLPAR